MSDEFTKEINELASKYDNIEIKSSSYNEEKGQLEMAIGVKGHVPLNDLPQGVEIKEKNFSAGDILGELSNLSNAQANRGLVQIDPLAWGDLDLAKSRVNKISPHEAYRRSIDYYRTKPVYGTHIDIFTNFAAKGFENDIDDPEIKEFFDNWVFDTKFEHTVDHIFFDFFRTGFVRTYKVLGSYEPQINPINSLPGRNSKPGTKKSKAAIRRNRYTNKHIPIAYTVLNPLMVEITGSLMFGQTAIQLKAEAGKEIKAMMDIPKNKRTEFQNKVLESLPAAFKSAAQNGEPIPLESELVGEVDNRRMPYERYPYPPSSRSFDSMEFKEELKKADYSTLDGITNYILLIRVGNDKHPITSQDVLARASELFDTVAKSYKIVWNHTMDIQKISSPEIESILGSDKYVQANQDITAGLGMIRALIDGNGEYEAAAVELAVKSVIETINYARKQVIRWIYNEYRAVAKVVGFDRIPKVRFDENALLDELNMMKIIQGMIDRRIISYRTGQKKLGFDPDAELAQMEIEKPLVEKGILGLVGSPFQQSRQTTQGTPRGTPSEGRPVGGPAPTPKKKNDPTGSEDAKLAKYFARALNDLSLEELEELAALKRLSGDNPDKYEG